VFDHVTIRVSDGAASEAFYDLVLGTLGIERTSFEDDFAEWDDFSLSGWSPGKPVTRRLHVAFVAPSHEAVEEFWRAGTGAGYRSDGEPGLRTEYRDDYYGSFLLDPDGNSAEAVHHGAMREGGVIDHLWFRVADLAAAGRRVTLGNLKGQPIEQVVDLGHCVPAQGDTEAYIPQLLRGKGAGRREVLAIGVVDRVSAHLSHSSRSGHRRDAQRRDGDDGDEPLHG
jgi:catechol 2,3-dioxygenase-like lactoylglutathione lyase family enzyme